MQDLSYAQLAKLPVVNGLCKCCCNLVILVGAIFQDQIGVTV